jgi:superfamily II DNA or RNA helicase
MKTTIKVENTFSWLYTDREDVRSLLWRSLRHKERGYFHSRLYKQKLWDGYTEFFKKTSGRFLTGLLPEVEAALNHLKVKYTIDDRQGDVQFQYPEVDKMFLDQWRPESMDDPFVMHDYQVEFTNQIIKYKRGVIQAPTSAGKSAVMLGILKTLPPDCPTLITSKSVTLVRQIYDDMLEWGIENSGKVFGSKKADFKPNIMTAVNIDSVHKLEKLYPKIRCLIVDEVHLMMSKVPKKLYSKLPAACVRVGVSATPFKFGGSDKSQKYQVKGYFGPILEVASAATEGKKRGVLKTETLQDRGILSKSKCTFFPVTEPQLPFDIYLDAVTNGIAENYTFHNMVTKLVSGLKGRTLIIVERLAHGDALSEMIPGSLWIRGEDNEDTRKEVIEKLKHSKEDVVAIATQGIFNAGINVFINNLVNAAGGQAEHQIIQRMGRGLRTANDKDQLNYFDFIFKVNDYLYDHSKKRMKILVKEGHDVEIVDEV